MRLSAGPREFCTRRLAPIEDERYLLPDGGIFGGIANKKCVILHIKQNDKGKIKLPPPPPKTKKGRPSGWPFLFLAAATAEPASEGKGRRRYSTSTRSFVLQDLSTLVGKSNPTSVRLKQRYPHVSEGISSV